MFEKASRLKLKFNTIKGNLPVELLWDLPLSSKTGFDLDSIAISVNKLIKEKEEVSFVKKRSSESKIDILRLEILKHIINVKSKEIEDKQETMKKKDMREKLLSIKAEHQDSELRNLTPEEVNKRLAELE